MPTAARLLLIALLAATARVAPRFVAARLAQTESVEALEAAVLRCLEKAPEKRFPNVGALAGALKPFATTAGSELPAVRCIGSMAGANLGLYAAAPPEIAAGLRSGARRPDRGTPHRRR